MAITWEGAVGKGEGLDPKQELINHTAQVITHQLIVIGTVALALYHWNHPEWVEGLLYGGGLAALLTAMLSASLQRVAETDREKGAAILYWGAAERFFVVAIAVTLAATVLDVYIGALVTGLILAHLVSFGVAIRQYGTLRQTERGIKG